MIVFTCSIELKAVADASYYLTPNGLYYIEYYQFAELSQDMIEFKNAMAWLLFGDAVTKIEEPTARYNCHSYAWYSQNTQTNTYWVPDPSPYYANQYKDYEETDGQVGDIICYFNAAGTNIHSGIVIARQTGTPNGICGDANLVTVRSKWAEGGLYEHQGDICPYVSTFGGHATYVKYYRLHTNHSLEYVSVGGTTYKEMCSYCGIQVHAHVSLYVSTGTGSQHSYSCSTSGCDYVAYESHTYGSSISSYDATAHYHACTACGYEQGQNHNFSKGVPIDDSYHNIMCAQCNYIPSSNAQEPHIWKTVGNRFICRICGLSRSTGGGPVPEPYGVTPEIE